ncbi:hypothetical protein IIA28_03235 [candidate division KSB1 bacterium]|nr:hypothetical protein [candidate division KSB1 bacterium]
MFLNKNFLVISILSLAGLTACADLFTEAPADNEIFDGPIDGLTAVQLKGFADGDEAFGQTFNVETGLGPVFNQTACISCHPDDGRGHPSTNLTRFGKMLPDGSFDYMLEFGGPQLQDRSIPGYPAETLPGDATGISVRGGPIAVGLGLIEAIPDQTILANEALDPNGPGITGRANFVEVPDYLEFGADKVVRDGKNISAVLGARPLRLLYCIKPSTLIRTTWASARISIRSIFLIQRSAVQ